MIQREGTKFNPAGLADRKGETEYLRWPPLGQNQELQAMGIKQISRNNHTKVLNQRASGRVVILMQRRGLLPPGSGLSGPDWVNRPYHDGRPSLIPERWHNSA